MDGNTRSDGGLGPARATRAPRVSYHESSWDDSDDTDDGHDSDFIDAPQAAPLLSSSSTTQMSAPATYAALVPQLRARLGDSDHLMLETFYVSALVKTRGNLDSAVSLIQNEQDFDMVDNTAVKGGRLVDGQVNAADDTVTNSSQPTPSGRAANPGPWNPRPGQTIRLTVKQKTAVVVFEDLAYPRILDEHVVRDHLEENEWNVGPAFTQWEAHRAELIRRTIERTVTLQENSLMCFMMDSGLPVNDNLEQERRDAARVFHDAILKASQSKVAGNISISEAILLLHNTRWNLTAAFNKFVDRNTSRKTLSTTYDHMRSPSSSRADQDERLATLATITQRPDLWALETSLTAFRWDLIKTIVAWYKKGIDPRRHPKDRDTNRNKGWNRRRDLDGDLHDVPTEEETVPATRAEPAWAKEPIEYKIGGKKHNPRQSIPAPARDQHLGSVIDEDHRPVQKGVPRPRKLHFESIWNGKYWQGRFGHNKYRWMGEDHPEFASLIDTVKQALLEKPPFDWNDAGHLEDLNKWRRQRNQRATSGRIRAPSQVFSQEEKDYLYQLSQQHVQELMKETGKSRERCLRMDVTEQVKKEWAQKFNEKFVGTMPAPHKRPIEARGVNALMTQRSRVDKIREDFMIGKIGAGRKGRGRDSDSPASEASQDHVSIKVEEETGTETKVEEEIDGETDDKLSSDEDADWVTDDEED